MAIGIMFSGMGLAQSAEINAEPGLIGAGSPLYGVDKAFDSATVAVGLRNQSDVVFERASEYAAAKESNNTNAVERAERSFNNSVARVASNSSTEGLEKAEQILRTVQERTPDQADAGLEKALSNIQGAREKAGRTDSAGSQPEDRGMDRIPSGIMP